MKEASKKTTTKKVAPRPRATTRRKEAAADDQAPASAAAPAPAAPAAAPDKPKISPEERYKMIQEAAYYIAERHGFNGDSAYFWSQAEAEINARFGI